MITIQLLLELTRGSVQFSSVAQSCPTLQPHGLQHARFPCPSPTSRAYSNSCPSSWWCHSAISSSVIASASCLQSFPASESFPVSQFFSSGGQVLAISPSTAYSGLISFRIDWLALLAVWKAVVELRRRDSWPLEEKNSIWGQRLGLITQSFCVTKFY